VHGCRVDGAARQAAAPHGATAVAEHARETVLHAGALAALACMTHMMTWHCTEMPVNRRAYWRIYLPRPAPRKQRGAGERVRRRASSTCPRDRSFLLCFTQLDAESKTRRVSKAIVLLHHGAYRLCICRFDINSVINLVISLDINHYFSLIHWQYRRSYDFFRAVN
jgi:hypothetical protein